MIRSLRMLIAIAPVVAFAPLAAQSATNSPIVAVLAFDNNAYGFAGAKDFDGIGKAISEVMIVDLATGGKVRVVDRMRVQQVLEEQKLTKEGAIDATTAVRIGRILGACYSVYGGFSRDMAGQNQLTVHTTNNETSQIGNPVKTKVTKSDDVTGLIADAAAEFISRMQVNACPGTGGTTRSADAGPAAQQQSSAPAQASTAAANNPPVAHVEYAKPLSEPEKKKLESVKLDSRTMLIYSRALDARDRKDVARARQLAQQVKDKYPNFVPADQLLDALKSGN